MSNDNRKVAQMCALDKVAKTDSNQFACSALIKTHCALAEDLYNEELAGIIGKLYEMFGCKAVIGAFQTVSSMIISCMNEGIQPPESDVWVAHEALLGWNMKRILTFITPDIHDELSCATALLVLRYPKNFGYPDDKGLEMSGINRFLSLNTAHQKSELAVHALPHRVIPFIRDYTHCSDSVHNLTVAQRNILDIMVELWAPITRYMVEFRDKHSDVVPEFSNGMTADHNKTLLSKTREYGCYKANYGDVMYPTCSPTNECAPDYCVLKAVPKNYKAPRMIAMEFCARNSEANKFRRALESLARTVAPMIPFWDQELQSSKMLDGTLAHSWNGTGWCSVDLSGASDSIPEWQVKYVLGNAYEQIATVRSSQIKLPSGKLIPSYIWLTSGNTLTWIFESWWFLTIAIAMTIYCERFDGKFRRIPKTIGPWTRLIKSYSDRIAIYGDDHAITSDWYDTFISALEILGYTVNRNKSYNGLFAESCGVDAYKGVDVTSLYWPRKGLQYFPKATWKSGVNATTVASLVAMQHKFYDYDKMAACLTRLVLRIAPGMTYSLPGTASDDLWGYMPVKTVNAPHDPDTELADPDSMSDPLAYQAAITREKHYVLSQSVNSLSNDSVLEMYMYAHWLEHCDVELPGPPCWVWINGRRYPAINDRYSDACRSEMDSVPEYKLKRV